MRVFLLVVPHLCGFIKLKIRLEQKSRINAELRTSHNFHPLGATLNVAIRVVFHYARTDYGTPD